MKHRPHEAKSTPRVVIDWQPNGSHRVYADAGVIVYAHSAHTPDDQLYRYTPEAVPEDWLKEEAGFRGDGSKAEQRLHSLLLQFVDFPSDGREV